jgi:adenosylcobinamide kinase / adenosylcobinamide-phosphate guanylyltransferase
LVRNSEMEMHYIATAEAWDAEMRTRIMQHRTDRGAGWVTVEAPLDLCGALAQVPMGAAVLVDCATLWLSNHLLADHDLEAECRALMGALASCRSPVVIVTNEVGLSVVPDNELARRFRDAQGRLNQDLAARSGLVVAVWAGLPLVLKGTLL